MSRRPSDCSSGSSAEPDARVICARLRRGHARALALMRRGRFIESYGPSIAAGDAIERAADRTSPTGAGPTPRARRPPQGSTSERSSSSIAGWPRSPATGCRAYEVHLLARRSRSSSGASGGSRQARGAAARRAGPGRAASRSRSWWPWPATTVAWWRSSEGDRTSRRRLLGDRSSTERRSAGR